ncbi:MAG: hypothetical protein JKX76_07985, partial [Colwellia sp.]|nr:hypothetical protein [Colwellia sp.]
AKGTSRRKAEQAAAQQVLVLLDVIKAKHKAAKVKQSQTKNSTLKIEVKQSKKAK